MAYTMKHILIAIALLALSMAVVARPEKADCASMSKALQLEDPKDDAEIVCGFISPWADNCTPYVKEANWALDLLSSPENEMVLCCIGGEFPNCNTPVSTPTIAIQLCGKSKSLCRPCKDVADALRPVLKKCQKSGKVVGRVEQGGVTFAITHPPTILRPCLLGETKSEI